jgi:hypothetical protein
MTSCEFETPAELHSLMSDNRIISDFILTMPCTLSKWLEVPIVDMFSELLLTEDTDRFRGLEMRLVMERKITIRLKIAYRFVVAEARIV